MCTHVRQQYIVFVLVLRECNIVARLMQDYLHYPTSTLPLHLISVCIVRTVRYLSSQGDSEAVRYTVRCPSRPGNDYCEFRGSGRSCSRSAAGISACSRPARQCPDRPVTPRSNPGMHAVSENSEFRISKCPDCIHAKPVRIPVLLILLHILRAVR